MCIFSLCTATKFILCPLQLCCPMLLLRVGCLLLRTHEDGPGFLCYDTDLLASFYMYSFLNLLLYNKTQLTLDGTVQIYIGFLLVWKVFFVTVSDFQFLVWNMFFLSVFLNHTILSQDMCFKIIVINELTKLYQIHNQLDNLQIVFELRIQ